MYERIFHSSPKTYGIAYLLAIPVFASLYYLVPGVLNSASLIDSLYFSVVTITTLGFGDIVPKTELSKCIVGFQAVYGVSVIGLFLNALSERRAEALKNSSDEESRKLLEMHICLLLEAVQSGNHLIWDKHAIHAKKMSALVKFAKELYAGILNESFKLAPLQIKALLETAHQNYNTFIGLIPVASSISASIGGQWISLVSNVRNLSDQYSHAVDGSVANISWPKQNDIALQVEEFIFSSFIVCNIEFKPNK
jgi:hypothetical protein